MAPRVCSQPVLLNTTIARHVGANRRPISLGITKVGREEGGYENGKAERY
jgi:hypothetical protein